MRVYVPQRQRLPARLRSISESAGFGLLASSAAAVMICPAWQKPHCGTASSHHARCSGWSPSTERPSIVVRLPSPRDERVGRFVLDVLPQRAPAVARGILHLLADRACALADPGHGAWREMPLRRARDARQLEIVVLVAARALHAHHAF